MAPSRPSSLISRNMAGSGFSWEGFQDARCELVRAARLSGIPQHALLLAQLLLQQQRIVPGELRLGGHAPERGIHCGNLRGRDEKAAVLYFRVSLTRASDWGKLRAPQEDGGQDVLQDPAGL